MKTLNSMKIHTEKMTVNVNIGMLERGSNRNQRV